jgi:hypothetical protein
MIMKRLPAFLETNDRNGSRSDFDLDRLQYF